MTPIMLYFFLSVMIGTVAFVRLYLALFPQTNLYIGKYNVHHLYAGALALVLASLFHALGFNGKFMFFLSGIASGLIVDQLVYLITTDGGHKAYFERRSFIGMLALIGGLVAIGLASIRLLG